MRDRLMIGPPGMAPVPGPGPARPPAPAGPGAQPPAPAGPGAQPPAPAGSGAQPSFQHELDRAVQGARAQAVRLSAHAEDRLRASGRRLSAEEMDRLAGAVDRAARKGARESLVLLPDLALVVSVRSRTVITAVAGERMKENIFTNIDSAVIL